MNNSNIDVDIIDETLLYICINGKREHISVDNARIKYAKNSEVLKLIDSVLEKYMESINYNENTQEDITPAQSETIEQYKGLDSNKDQTNQNIQEMAETPTDKKVVANNEDEIIEEHINDEKVDKKEAVETPETSTKPVPSNVVDERKFASIYDKYNSKFCEIFQTYSPSFLDVEKLTREKKENTLEQVK